MTAVCASSPRFALTRGIQSDLRIIRKVDLHFLQAMIPPCWQIGLIGSTSIIIPAVNFVHVVFHYSYLLI